MSFNPLLHSRSRTSKAFYTQLTIKQSGCEVCYTEALQVFLRALDTPYHHQILHSVVRQYLHRMIICLEESLLPYVPIAVEHLLKKCEARDIHEFIPLINQIAGKFKVWDRESVTPLIFRHFHVPTTPCS